MMGGQSIQIKGLTFTPYISRKEIEASISELATQINRDYQDKHLIILGVLDGAAMVVSDLVRMLNLDLEMEFMRLKSYNGLANSGSFNSILQIQADLRDKHVLIVEDIVDTGNTLVYLMQVLNDQNLASLEVATLLMKDEVFQDKLPIRYVGKHIENKFVLGYGMDYDGLGRQFPDIYALHED